MVILAQVLCPSAQDDFVVDSKLESVVQRRAPPRSTSVASRHVKRGQARPLDCRGDNDQDDSVDGSNDLEHSVRSAVVAVRSLVWRLALGFGGGGSRSLQLRGAAMARAGAVAAMGTVARHSLPVSLVCASTSRHLASSLWGSGRSVRTFMTSGGLGFELQGEPGVALVSV